MKRAYQTEPPHCLTTLYIHEYIAHSAVVQKLESINCSCHVFKCQKLRPRAIETEYIVGSGARPGGAETDGGLGGGGEAKLGKNKNIVGAQTEGTRSE